MRRLPIYLLLDTSTSMTGEPIEQVKNGLQMLVSALRQDPHALETAHLSVITFDSTARQLVPLTDLASFQPPELKAAGTTDLGAALKLVANQASTEVTRSSAETKGDWKPMVFLMTDGAPDQGWEKGLEAFKAQRWGIVVGCAVGLGDTKVLQQIAGEAVVKIETADASSIGAFFRWVSASISTGSQRVETAQKDVSSIGELPPPPPEIDVVAI